MERLLGFLAVQVHDLIHKFFTADGQLLLIAVQDALGHGLSVFPAGSRQQHQEQVHASAAMRKDSSCASPPRRSSRS